MFRKRFDRTPLVPVAVRASLVAPVPRGRARSRPAERLARAPVLREIPALEAVLEAALAGLAAAALAPPEAAPPRGELGLVAPAGWVALQRRVARAR
jgi:hypothetical protein